MGNARTWAGLGLVGAGAALLAWWASRANVELPDVPAPTADPLRDDPMIPTATQQQFAVAIATAEGFYVPGSIPQRARNPGDLKLGNLGQSVPGSVDGRLGEGITVMGSEAEGWQRLYHQIDLMVTGHSVYYKPTMTILDVARIWTGTERDAWASNVARALGVPVTTTLATLFGGSPV